MGSVNGTNDRDAVLAATDLVALIGEHVVLKRQGREHVGLCPFHDDRSPSMHVVTHKGTSFYKCFACGAGGNAIDFMMAYHHLDFGDALRHLAERAGIQLSAQRRPRGSGEVSREDLLEANRFAMRYFRKVLMNAVSRGAGGESGGGGAGSGGIGAAAIVAQRCISDAMSEAFVLGAAADRWDGLAEAALARGGNRDAFVQAGLLRQRQQGDGVYDTFRNRLMFPICDELGKPIAFGGRKIRPEDEPKYVNSPESPLFSKSRTLYGLHVAKSTILSSRTVVVTEGYTDVIACHQAGLTNVVATLGTALTRDHARTLKRICETVVLLFDGDEAGMKAADRAVEVFLAEPIDVRICTLPDGLDPDDLLRQEDGRARFEQALAASEDALAHLVRRLTKQMSGTSSLSGRQRRLEAILAHLAGLGFSALGGVRKRLVISALSDLTGIPMDEIERATPKAATPRVAPTIVSGTGGPPSGGVGAPTGTTTSPFTGAPPRGGLNPASSPALNGARHPGAPGPVAETDVTSDLECSAEAFAAGADDDAPPYLVEAERAFIGVLLCDPPLLETAVPVEDGMVLSIAEAYPPESMRVAAHRVILDVLLTRFESGASPDLQYILDDLRDRTGRSRASAEEMPESATGADRRFSSQPRGGSGTQLVPEVLRDLASSLYLRACRRIEARPAGQDRTPAALLEQCRMDLDSARSRHFSRRRRVDTPSATSDQLALVIQSIDALRERGADPTAIARSVRR